jgi:hypothetical protein
MSQNSSIAQALQGLSRWLTSDLVLRSVGNGAGTANWLWPDGTYDGLYPEIAGYYLQFLTRTECSTAPVAAPREMAARVTEWLDRIAPDGAPLTLYHRDMAQSDWRNQCLFAFDLAMILRGFACVEARWPGTVPAELFARYSRSMFSLVEGHRLRSHNRRAGASAGEIPAKWSTLIDVHHVKIAGALAGTGSQFTDVVSATVDEQADALIRDGYHRMREMHPFLYSIEGWLMLWGQTGSAAHLDRAGVSFEYVLRELHPTRGTLPAIAGRNDIPGRSDVLAQALRAGLVLEHCGRLAAAGNPDWSVARAKLQTALLARVTPEGAIEFDEVGHHRNVWASLFAWQALDLSTRAENGLVDAREAAAALI